MPLYWHSAAWSSPLRNPSTSSCIPPLLTRINALEFFFLEKLGCLSKQLYLEMGSRVHMIAFLTRPRWPALTPRRAWASWNNTRSPFLACWWWLISFPFVPAKIREVTLRLLKVRCLGKYNLHREFHKFSPDALLWRVLWQYGGEE